MFRATRTLTRTGGSLVSPGRKLTTWAFIGLGRMGAPMATNLHHGMAPDDVLLLYDTNPSSLTPLLASLPRSKRASGLREIGASADVIVTMLPDSQHVEECYFGDTGFCFDQPPITSTATTTTTTTTKASLSRRWLIDCSTIDPRRSTAIHDRLAGTLPSATFVDAPVSGGVRGAEERTLSFMVGHDRHADLDAVLHRLGTTVHYCGSSGAGLSAKLCNNYLLALGNLATAESMRLGIALGLDPAVLGRVINSSTGKCWPSEKNNPVAGVTPGAPVERNYSGGFGIELMMKDLGLALGAAKAVGVELALSQPAKRVYETVQQARDGKYRGKDFGVVYQYLKDNADEKDRER
ncbi:protein of unknown function [Taphrina deformans PYCC 5710]|uniref:3-hydroxyisobutyrate dehydrogenase n=1 Tax=Taphrina deformans (strain PYCC 5710 / ATCC 11124 / CBS 356.35 / IMI 108563 / JCM 9778 / NBRC 8474) TaxID=1097556 RepID=R4XFP1_TAPDE|nr:protein of unknown function [Taphrina deformans PYCC 5710]|eukprot:CCG84671.1 protein of unknown function [Taphrina deformans PYCC 5710]